MALGGCISIFIFGLEKILPSKFLCQQKPTSAKNIVKEKLTKIKSLLPEEDSNVVQMIMSQIHSLENIIEKQR